MMAATAARLSYLVRSLAGRRILVAGDLVVDRYVFGEPSRLSREAPVVIARRTSEQLIPGGAANAARNLHALGASVQLAGLVGDDAPGRWLVDHLAILGLDVSTVSLARGRESVTKTRFLVGDPNRTKQQVFRLDHEPKDAPTPAERQHFVQGVTAALANVDALLCSDYGYGLLDPDSLGPILAAARGRVVSADSRYRIDAYVGVTMATPNESELEGVIGRRIATAEDLELGGRTLLARLRSPSLLVTRGNKGMALFRPLEPRIDIAATGSDEVTDVSGAGDTVIAVATLALAAGATAEEAARLANCAAGVVVMKLGAATCSPEELLRALESHA